MREHHRIRSALFATVAIVSAASPGAAWAQTRSFNVQAQPAATGVAELARQADAQILISAQDAAGKTTNAVLGEHTTEDALRILVSGTGLLVRLTGPNTYSVFDPPAQSALEQAAPDTKGVPDVLVVGRRNFSLNTGIERTRDDAQPFVVFDQEQIRRTGATSLEQFLSQQLTSNATQGTSEFGQNSAGGALLGRSRVDLRGLGQRETLILIDGRRQPGINNLSGDLEQPVITNIPLASIERIEVLSSSASGLYGVGATGGVINVVLRRDYEGGEITLNYADTTDIANADGRIDVTLGKAIEGGRTNLTFTGSYRRSDPLTRAERRDFIVGNTQFVLANDPNYLTTPPLGATPNIRTTNGANLVLKPRFGGASLGSNRTFVPIGFRGVAQDGVAGLVANAGQYNLDLANTAAGAGGLNEVIVGAELLSGTLAVRREMASWLRVYAEVFGSRSNQRSISGGSTGELLLGANNPNNPFTRAIRVTRPLFGYDEVTKQQTDQLRLVGGAIATLGDGWSAAVDVSYGKSWYTFAERERDLDERSVLRLSDGTYDPLVDTATPFAFDFIQAILPTQDNESDLRDIQLKIAGPLPITLPGGRPVVSLNLESSKQDYSEAFSVTNDATGAFIEYIPSRGEEIQSAYGEIRIPLIGDATNIPLIQELEITAAVRYERYKGRGSGEPTDASFRCFEAPDGFPAGEIDLSACNPDNIDFEEERVSNSNVSPNIAVRWKVIPDITLRASYATGYLPPRLNQLIRNTTSLAIAATDPERGNEPIGEPLFDFIPNNLFISGFAGGNADVENEKSKSLTAGFILTPRFIPGLRFSADYTRIRKRNNYADPGSLLFTQANFLLFLEKFPERVTRGPASDGFSVGPITSIDASIINIAGTRVEAIDFAADYGFKIAGGTLDISASATRTIESSTQIFPTDPEIDYVGVVPVGVGSGSIFANGAQKWRGVASVRWSNDSLSIGWRGRYLDSYFVDVERVVVPEQGAAKVPSQFYQDVFGSYTIGNGFSLRAGVNNLFDKEPPYVLAGYSTFGDPRLRNFYINLTTAF